MPTELIVLAGINCRKIGFLDSGHKLAVEDEHGVGRVLIRDTLDGPWRLWAEADWAREEAKASKGRIG